MQSVLRNARVSSRLMALKRAVLGSFDWCSEDLTTETVQSAALAFESVDDVHGGHGLALGVLGVGDGIADHVLQEHLQDTSGFLVDQTGDSLDTTTTSETADGGLGDALDVVAKNLSVTLGATLAESLASFATARHDRCLSCFEVNEWKD